MTCNLIMQSTPPNAPTEPAPAPVRTVTTSTPISLCEWKLLMRLRGLQKETHAPAEKIRVELEVDASQIVLIDFRPLRCEVFA